MGVLVLSLSPMDYHKTQYTRKAYVFGRILSSNGVVFVPNITSTAVQVLARRWRPETSIRLYDGVYKITFAI